MRSDFRQHSEALLARFLSGPTLGAMLPAGRSEETERDNRTYSWH